MDLKKYNKLKQLINDINRPSSVFTRESTMNVQRESLVSVALLALQIVDFAPDLLEKDKQINIYVAGADFVECGFNGEQYKLLNKLLGSEQSWVIHLIEYGQTTIEHLSHPLLTKNAADERINVTHSRGKSLQEYMNEYGLPDMLALNNLGLEKFHSSWLSDDDGIAKCIKEGIPVVGSSYGRDEFKVDNLYFEAYGISMKNYAFNQLCSVRSPTPDLPKGIAKAIESGACNWSGTYWVLESKGLDIDEDKLEIVKDIETCTSSIADYLMVTEKIHDPLEVPTVLHRKEDGEHILRVYGNYSVNIDQGLIFDEMNGRIHAQGVEVDLSGIDFDDDVHLYVNSLLVGQKVFSQYIKDNIQDDDSDDLFDDEDDDDLIFDPVAMKAMEAIFGNGRELTDSDKNILAMIDKEDYEAISALQSEEVLGFKDHLGRNLASVAATKNSIPLLKIACDNGVDIHERDSDSFNFLDTAAEYNSYEVAKFSLDNGITTSILNSADWRNITPCLRAAMRTQKRMAKLYSDYGADLDVPNIGGVTARSVINHLWKDIEV